MLVVTSPALAEVGEDEEEAPAPAAVEPAGGEASTIARYYQELESTGLIDVETGTKDLLSIELGKAEKLLREGAFVDSSVALYGIVESPRFTDFDDLVEYQNAEYLLGVALASAGAYDSALSYLLRAISRGPSSMYFAPAHRRAIDIGIETKDYEKVLGLLEGNRLNEPLPPGPVGERAYLRARIAYTTGEFDKAEGELVRISRKSRLYSSELYLRGVIRTRKGQFKDAADALCEIVDTPDDDVYTFVVDDRYFTIKDLARLGLGRIAHEAEEYEDAYYHYFQIPDDSERLPEALFEAGWSMYQRRELATARDLVKEFKEIFATSPLIPEARLLAGYIELADCRFDDAMKSYDKLVADLQPIVDEIDKIRKDPDRRAALFDRALVRWRAERSDPDKRLDVKATSKTDRVLGLLRLDPRFVRLHDAVSGLRRAAGDAPHVVRSWRKLGRRMDNIQVKTIAEENFEEEEKRDALVLVEDIRRLRDDVGRSRQQLRRGVRDGTLPKDVAKDESKRLDGLTAEIDKLEEQAESAANDIDDGVGDKAPPGLKPMVKADLKRARDLKVASTKLMEELSTASDAIAQQSIEKLYQETRRVLDKAKLGKIDAVIGQKRRYDIEVQDLAAGRFPEELHGRLWEEGLIGDDEEFWPFQGEFWKDEYEGWR
jgi:tetratricopeptide (TPR) repeat protein